MTVFAKKIMAVTEWAAVQDRIGELQMAMGAPHDLMMFSGKSTERGKETIYIALPDRTTLSQFGGFELIEQSELPDFLSTLVCREDGFAEHFPDIAKKRRVPERGK